VATPRARQKIKQYFSALEEEELLVRGRGVLTKEIQREGHGQVSIDDLATRLGFKNAEALFIAAGRGEVGPRAIQVALRGAEAVEPEGAEAEVAIGHSHAGDAGDTILIVGVGKLMTSLGRCCKPAPPDAIQGYVTRGRGVSIHRVECRDFQALARKNPERLVSAQWGGVRPPKDAVFPVDILVQAMDRQGLLRDISEVLPREAQRDRRQHPQPQGRGADALHHRGAGRAADPARGAAGARGEGRHRRRAELAAMISLQRMDRHHFAWLSIAAAVSTIALKTLAWWITGSVGLLSDALESFVNLAGASFALWMILVTRAPTASTPSATARPSISRVASRAS
jgi:hypothetical protein